jgi:transcription antitermination protein NusB
MLYQWEIGRAGVHEAIVTYWPAREPDERLDEANEQFANDLLRGTVARVEEIDRILAERAQNWRVERMAVIDRLVLRLGVYELLAVPDTPGKVVINEAIELARAYSGEEAVGFVNGILDAVRKDLHRD